MDRFRSIEAFVRVAETQSFAEAARQLGVAKSVVTTRVQQLEEFVSAPLFHRTTRSVRLSEIGHAFYRDCADLIGRTEGLVELMRDMRNSPSGVLRVHALPGFVLGHLALVLRDFQDRYPGIQLDLVVNDAVIDPVREGFDCALQIFPPSSGALVQRQLFPVRRIFCASPAYLKSHGEPRHPRELRKHRLGLYSRYPTGDHWEFHRGKQRVSWISRRCSAATACTCCATMPASMRASSACRPRSRRARSSTDRLRILLPGFQLTAFWLSAVFPPTHRSTFKLKLFVESIAAGFTDGPPWDRALIERGLIPPQLLE